jgi:hypothetical protein
MAYITHSHCRPPYKVIILMLDALFFLVMEAIKTNFNFFSLLNHLNFYYVKFQFYLLFYKGVIEYRGALDLQWSPKLELAIDFFLSFFVLGCLN